MYPQTWVQGQCTTITMNCADPTLQGVAHISFSLSGNYTSGFTKSNVVTNGVFELCYNRLVDGNYEVSFQNILIYTFNTLDTQKLFVYKTGIKKQMHILIVYCMVEKIDNNMTWIFFPSGIRTPDL